MRPRPPAERTLVIGAGLVGCVLAMYLARRGINVTIYERNADWRDESPSRRPSLSLSLCTRGIRSLERIGVMDRLRPMLAPAFGRMIHAADGTVSYQPYSVFGEAIYCVSRRALSIELLNAAEEHGVEILFERRCVDVNVSGEITIEDRSGARRHDRAGAIFGADGSSSVVRRALERDGWCQCAAVASPEGYKEFRIAARMAAAVGLRCDVLHGWPRPAVIAGAFPEPEGSFLGTLHMPLAGPESFESVSDPSTFIPLLERECPELARAVPDLGERLAAQRPNSLVTVACRPWSAGGNVLLIGDSAHAMLPYYGQGANAGFQDCEILDDLVDRHGTDWARLFLEFEAIRKPDIDAMAELCREHLAVLQTRVGQPDFQAQWRLEQRLHGLMPDSFTPLYSMIAFSSMSYAEARRRDRYQEGVVQELLRLPDIERTLDEPLMADVFCRHVRSRLSAARLAAHTRFEAVP